MTAMMKSLAIAKLLAPILSELSTIKVMSRGPHLHSEQTQRRILFPLFLSSSPSPNQTELESFPLAHFKAKEEKSTHHNKLKKEKKKRENP